ncbi:MAG: DMT family transporter [Methylococcales bacterium]|nr:DMT family transporter [Methylococcales bacterium]
MFTPLTEQRQLIVGYGLVLLGALGFSSKAIFIKLAYAANLQVDALTLLALRMAFAMPFFMVVVLWQALYSPSMALTRKQWVAVIVLGLIGYYIASYLDFLGLQFISAGLERVIIFLYPTFVVLFSALFYRRKIPSKVAVALGLSYVGTLLVFVEHLTMATSGLLLGSGFVLSSAVIFSWFVMGSGEMTRSIGSARFTAYTMIVAGTATLVHFGCRLGVPLIPLPVLPYAGWERVYGLALLMAIFSTVLPAFLMNAGIRRIGAGSASIISTLGPIATLILAYLFLGEAITPVQLAGTFFVLAGVYVVGRVKF